MSTLTPKLLALIPVSSLCAACATGGSFDTSAVPPAVPINHRDKQAPEEKDNIVQGFILPKTEQTPHGFSAAEPYVIRTSSEAQRLDPDKLRLDTESDFDTINYHFHPDSGAPGSASGTRFNIDPGNWKASPAASDYSEYMEGNEGGHYALIEENGNVLKAATFAYTRVGAVRMAPPGQYDPELVNLFYRGLQVSDAVPVSGSATYNGYWERALQTHANDYVNGYRGNLLNASMARFEVDFGARKITGELHGRNGERPQGYRINADISGMKFQGVAQHTDYSDVSEDATVSGAFFGPQAAELAGHLAGNEGRAVGVFAARQTDAAGLVGGEPSGITHILRAETAITQPAAGIFQDIHTLAFSGDVNLIRYNGILLDLRHYTTENSDLCCETPHMQFTKIGALYPDPADIDGTGLLYFSQGHLTPQQEMPATGQFTYKGRWLGMGRAPAGQAYIARSPEHEARFTVDFAARTLSGVLQGNTGADVISVDAAIAGNRFEGLARINTGLTADRHGVDIGSDAKITGSASLSGAFFGVQANELTGTFINDDKSFGGVFGAKQQTIGLDN